MTSPARVLLLYPGPVWAGDTVHRRLPVKLPLLSLYSYLAAHEVPVEVLDLQNELGIPEPTRTAVRAYLDTGAATLAARAFDVLAISCWTSFDYAATMALAARSRRAAPHALIVTFRPARLPAACAPLCHSCRSG